MLILSVFEPSRAISRAIEQGIGVFFESLLAPSLSVGTTVYAEMGRPQKRITGGRADFLGSQQRATVTRCPLLFVFSCNCLGEISTAAPRQTHQALQAYQALQARPAKSRRREQVGMEQVRAGKSRGSKMCEKCSAAGARARGRGGHYPPLIGKGGSRAGSQPGGKVCYFL
ncbi:hypothetical protein IWW45_009308 [Coemansia sp. RSA 485]|nr:hypothetical protein IWW45_009308 [Coemansia sp. RSA 485]